LTDQKLVVGKALQQPSLFVGMFWVRASRQQSSCDVAYRPTDHCSSRSLNMYCKLLFVALIIIYAYNCTFHEQHEPWRLCAFFSPVLIVCQFTCAHQTSQWMF